MYRDDNESLIFVKMVVASEFIPVDDIDLAIESLSEYLSDDLQPLLDWFEYNYEERIDRKRRRRRLPLYPPNIWNMYSR